MSLFYLFILVSHESDREIQRPFCASDASADYVVFLLHRLWPPPQPGNHNEWYEATRLWE
jgi:hypothetical protein